MLTMDKIFFLKKWEVPIIGVIQHAMTIMCYQWHWKLILQLKWDVAHAMHTSNGYDV